MKLLPLRVSVHIINPIQLPVLKSHVLNVMQGVIMMMQVSANGSFRILVSELRLKFHWQD